MSEAALPPLPQWSRVSHLDRANYPKPFLKDRLQPLPSVSPGDLMQDEEMSANQVAAENMSQRVQYLEKSIIFLRNQHREMLGNLHEEVESLKTQNKELQFKLVVLQRGSESPLTNNEGSRAAETEDLSEDGIRMNFLSKQVNDLSTALKEQQQRNRYLQQLIDQQSKDLKKQRSESAKRVELEKQREALAARLEMEAEAEEPLPPEIDLGVVKVLINPLMVLLPDSEQPREPSRRECESIIKQMFRNSLRQEKEIQHLRADLKDVLYRYKWHPEGATSAKTADSDAASASEFLHPGGHASASGKLLATAAGIDVGGPEPEMKTVMQGQKILPLRGGAPAQRKLPELPVSQFVTKDNVSLPALKQTLGTKAAERRRRTQVLQKARASAPPSQSYPPHPPATEKP